MLGVLARGVLGLLARTFDFRTGHRDSMGGSKTYRGGSAQWMRTGAGAQHEEFWETHSASVQVSRGDGVTSEGAQV